MMTSIRSPFLWLMLAVVLAAGCYDHTRGNPVDRHHYDHTITVTSDYSQLTIRTYVNRTHLKVGVQLEDIYDGNRDGELTTDGMDRVWITNYASVEDPPESADRKVGEIRNYDDLFQRIIGAVKSGQPIYKRDDRTYRIRLISGNLPPMADGALG